MTTPSPMTLALAEAPDMRHAKALEAEMAWLERSLAARLAQFLRVDGPDADVLATPPDLPTGSALDALVRRAGLDAPARLVLALALSVHIKPDVLDPLMSKNAMTGQIFTEFGLIMATGPVRPIPTGETALFLVAGMGLVARAGAMALLDPDHPLRTAAQLSLERAGDGGGAFAGRLAITADQVLTLCHGRPAEPDRTPDFPARRLTTALEWDDLVLPPAALDQIEQIAGWQANRETILSDWNLERHIGPGFRVLFHGPPGTGKTLTAALLGKRTGMEVYRIDLSMVVSKYIGETEKNLAQIFDRADRDRWILFFDEADALFGNRTSTGSAQERYANQEVAYLLQRIEASACLTILATNLRNNIDEAFFRRFQLAVYFQKPDAAMRRRLWQSVMGGGVPLNGDVDLGALAERHALSGGAINNVARAAAISALRRGAKAISVTDLDTAVAVEMRKEGRTA